MTTATVAKPTVQKTRYSVEISDNNLVTILDAENWCWTFKHLYEQLNALPGVLESDYNGHFGGQILYTLQAEADTQKAHATIAKIIKNHIAQCKKLTKQPEILNA